MLERLVRLKAEYDALLPYAGTDKWFQEGPYSIDNCPRHKMFFDAGNKYRERMFLAANRAGKTLAGAFETACHLTGRYPEWWTGRRFDHPIKAWAAGQTAQTTRDTVQKELLGPVNDFGSGTVPRELIISTSARSGTANAIDTALIRHVSGGESVLGFKSYDQDMKSYMGTARDWCWCDEEPPELIYNEMLFRTMTTKGSMIATFTPLHGLTPFIVSYHKTADKIAGSAITAEEAEEDLELIKLGKNRFRAIVRAGWDHAPWLGEEEKIQMLSNTPPHLRKSRSEGIPGIGSGNVYPLHLDDIVCEPFPIPAHWKRLYAMDVGWNKTAGLWMAVNPETDEAYLYAEYYQGQELPQVHAARFKEMSLGWINGVIDPASRGRSQADGQKLIQIYRQNGLRVREAKNEVEAGIHRVWERLSNGKLKVFRTLVNFKNEFMIYRRDLNGKIIKENDHLMDAMRYLINCIDWATAQHISGPFDLDGGGSGRSYYT